MEIINEKQLRRLVDESDACVTLKSEEGIEYEVSLCHSIHFFYEEENLKAEHSICGYKVGSDSKTEHFEDYAALIEFLREKKIFKEEGGVLTSINSRYSTFSEYEEQCIFDNLDMRGLLEKYEGIADSFELIGDYDTSWKDNVSLMVKGLEQERFCALKPHLIFVKSTNSTHCTTGALCTVFRFRLTEETKNWLLKYKTDYDLEVLEDLAFYQGEKLLFSSCTHEGFHCDYSKNKDE